MGRVEVEPLELGQRLEVDEPGADDLGVGKGEVREVRQPPR